MTRKRTKHLCESCKMLYSSRKMRLSPKGYLCHKCWTKDNKKSIITERKLISLEEALKKIRIVRFGFGGRNGNPEGVIHVPNCLIGKKVKILLVE